MYYDSMYVCMYVLSIRCYVDSKGNTYHAQDMVKLLDRLTFIQER